MTSELGLILPDWPAPGRVRAASTTRQGGVSAPPWDSLNLGLHVEDDPGRVAKNRQRLAEELKLAPDSFGWLAQVHGTDVVSLPVSGVPEADAAITDQPWQVCAILTADCLPVLLCDQAGTQVAAAHAGWRGLCNGILEQVLGEFSCPAGELMAWLGPAIGPDQFEVGAEVRQAFIAADARAEEAFIASDVRPGHFLANIYQLARQRLERAGVGAVYGGGLCTVSDPERFYSYRRDGRTGRMATLIWLDS